MPLILLAVLSLLGIGIVLYSQTWAFTGDEGFHLLAAQLIEHGRRPYIDFCFPQTPLNAYCNAFLMRVFGESWRVTHAFAALCTVGALVLATQFVHSRLPQANWKTAAAIAAALGIGLNVVVVEYGPLAQAYGICLLLAVAAFRLAVAAVNRRGPALHFLAGLSAGTAAGASLLTGSFGAAIGLWLLLANRAGNRWLKAVAFLAGAALPFVPALLLYVQSPDVVRFNLLEYHLFFRKLYWPQTTEHDLEINASWIDSGQALLLGLMAVAGLLFIRYRSGWESRLKSEFYLCFWMSAALALELCTAHPTFSRYFMLMVPFVGILAAVGVMFVSSALYSPVRNVAPVVLWGFLFALGFATSEHHRLADIRIWKDLQQMAAKVKEVTPPGGMLYTDEAIYFLLKWTPPPGLEFSYSHELNFGPKKNAALHIIPLAELKKIAAAKTYDTMATCDDDDIDTFKMRDLYENEVEAGGCNVFWGKK